MMFKRPTSSSSSSSSEREMETPLLSSSTSTCVETAVPLGTNEATTSSAASMDLVDVNLLDDRSDHDINNNNNNDEDDDDDNKVIDAKCTLMSKSYIMGIIVGMILQGMSFYVSAYVKSTTTATASSTATTTQQQQQHHVVIAFMAYIFSKYWMPIALLLPAAIVAIKSRSLPGHLRLEAFFSSLKFQFGLFFGSLILLSLVNFYALAATAPIPLLLAYYAVCLGVSFIALCLLQVFVNEVCANVSSIEVIVNYEDNTTNSKNNKNDRHNYNNCV